MHSNRVRVAFITPSTPVQVLPVRSPPREIQRCRRRPRSVPVMRFFPGPVRILNGRTGSSRRWSRPSSSDVGGIAPDISAELKRAIQLLYVGHVTPDGVDYSAMKASPEFADYVTQTQRLSQLDLSTTLPDDPHKIAFFVNLYNALTQHGIIVLGPPQSSSIFRLFFALGVGYTVGQFRLSLNEIENGILRGNRGIAILPRPFGKNDPKKSLCVSELDPRIHFVLNCGANSCPPVLFLTAENLEQSLSIATIGFLKDSGNFSVDGNTVELSQIFNWYKEDFSSDKEDRGVLEWIVANGDAEQHEVKEVARIVRQHQDEGAISWKTYDWKLNSL